MALFNIALKGFGRGVIDTTALDNLDASGDVTVGGTLDVTGETTVGDLAVGGDASVAGDLVLSGDLNGITLPVNVDGPGTDGANILAALESLGILNDTSE